jgi:hypothetical protein
MEYEEFINKLHSNNKTMAEVGRMFGFKHPSKLVGKWKARNAVPPKHILTALNKGWFK